ncbi:sigma factor [Micromonospora sp. NPDC004551]|uniref:RNA polymerase sigma factor n=1 Tax=Micromonospora sp. NPDC004551 TaxID=3154284 RepID=UPI0033BF2265
MTNPARFGGGAWTVDDLQEAFTRALAAPRRFVSLENPEAWLRRVAVNVARSRHRRRRLFDTMIRRLGPPPVVADRSPEHLALLAALRGLPEGQRQALALHGAGPGLAWLYDRDDPSDAGPDHVIVTADGTTWKRFGLPH